MPAGAVEGMKLGAFDYLVKPPDIGELTEKIKKAFQTRQDGLRQYQQEWLRNIVEKYPD